MFITFEGTEGSGKTTQVGHAIAYLKSRGYNVLATREPGGTGVGDEIRRLLLENSETSRPLDVRTELLLFNASRAQLVRHIIRPHLEQGGVVICDRYVDSTIAYQGFGHQQDVGFVADVTAYATGGLFPDVTIFLDLPPEIGLRRRAAGSLFGEEWNRMDDMELGFHKRVYEGYRAIGEDQPERWVRVDARGDEDTVRSAITRVLNERMPVIER